MGVDAFLEDTEEATDEHEDEEDEEATDEHEDEEDEGATEEVTDEHEDVVPILKRFQEAKREWILFTCPCFFRLY